jgi:crotonobetainyl-CoA:carnitine CoA-transferase CaiB-like acyl-CoA transferase
VTDSAGPARGLLDGIRVLDLTRDLSGPYTSMMMAENGADVIEVERPDTGDETRSWPPMVNDELSGYFATVNRSKRSLALDLKAPDGLAVARELAARADVVMQSFTPGVATRLGLGFEQVRELSPHVVYYSLSGYGQTGPMGGKRGYDPILQAASGFMSVLGDRHSGPVKSVVPVADLMTAIHGYAAILAGLVAVARDPQAPAQHIDMAMMDVMVASLSVVASRYLITGVVPEPSGAQNPQRVPSAAFECGDGRYLQVVPNQRQWQAFCGALGHPEWKDDPRFATPLARVAHQDELYPMIREILRAREIGEWVAEFDRIGVACSPIYNLAEVFALDQVRLRECVRSYDYPGAGAVPALALPFRYSDARCDIRSRPPMIGEHSAEVLRELGHSEKDIARMLTAGVIATPESKEALSA